MDRMKLETAIEREVYRFIEQIKEHMFDHSMIFLNRNNVDVDRTVAANLLEIAKRGVEDGLLSKIDGFKKNLDKALTEFSETENPTQPTKQSKKVAK